MMKIAFTGTRYEAILKLYEPETITFVGDNPDVAKVSYE